MSEVVNITGPQPAAGPSGETMWLVGCGNMAGAMVQGWQAAGVDLGHAVAIRPSGTPVDGVRTVSTLGEAGGQPDLVLLGFKPQKLDEVAPELVQRIGPQTVVISILAGVEAASLRSRFPDAKAIVRAMPNVPVAIRRGVVALFSSDADEALQSRMRQLFMPLGLTVWCADEAELGTIGSVAGAGPAYAARFIAALASAGEARGLDSGLALTIARETVLGTAWLAATTGEPMDEIVRRVKSPRGTTEAGLEVLDAMLSGLIQQTIAAAARRSRELADEAVRVASPSALS